MSTIVNSRADLDALAGTPAYLETLLALRGATIVTLDTALYPEGYGMPGYQGPTLAPLWTQREDQTSLERLGLSLAEIEAAIAALGGPAA